MNKVVFESYYFLYLVVFRMDCEMMNVRVVYDGLVKVFKEEKLLNDCL